jgi:hypothetical protein
MPTYTQLRANWHTDSLDMLVLPSTGASRYHNCCIDGGNRPEYFFWIHPSYIIFSYQSIEQMIWNVFSWVEVISLGYRKAYCHGLKHGDALGQSRCPNYYFLIDTNRVTLLKWLQTRLRLEVKQKTLTGSVMTVERPAAVILTFHIPLNINCASFVENKCLVSRNMFSCLQQTLSAGPATCFIFCGK